MSYIAEAIPLYIQMSSLDFYLHSKDGLKLHGIKCECRTPVAVVLMIHGLGEHIGRYAHVAEVFNRKQIDFWGFDLRGHGRSEGRRGHTASIHHLLDDVEQLVLHIGETHPELPIVLYGHSMGGNIALNYLLNRPSKEISLGIITSPWLRLTNPPTGFQLVLANFGARFFPSLAQPNGLDVQDISSVKEEQEAYAYDPLNHDSITAKLFKEINQNGEKAIALANTLKTPILLAHGSADNITSPKGSEEFANSAPKSFVKLKRWNGLRHETHNEYKKEEVIEYYVNWVVEFLGNKKHYKKETSNKI